MKTTEQLRKAPRHLHTLAEFIGRVLVEFPTNRILTVVYTIGMAVFYLAGAGALYYLLNGGAIQLNLHDWAEVTAPRYAFLKNAVTEGRIPLHMPGFWGLRNITDRFWAVPDTNLGPQILMLRYMDLGRFFLFQTWLLYTIGFAGVILLARFLRLSLLLSGALLGLMFFNGNIVDHIVVGHVNWSINFLFPYFVYLILRLLDGWQNINWIALMAAFLFALILQGAFHLFVACLFFLGLLWLVATDVRRPIFLSGVFASGLGAVRLLPPLLELNAFDTVFLSGYPTTLNLVEALVVLHPALPEFVFSSSGLTNLNWWEFDLYVGLIGALMIVGFGVKALFFPGSDRYYYRLLALPILTMTVLSIGRVYKLLHLTQIPLLASQRVSSRMIFVPFAVLLVLAIDRFQRWLGRPARAGIYKTTAILATILIANDLWQHTKMWRVVNMGRLFPPKELDLAVNTLANHPDAPYHLLLGLGLAISTATALILTYMTFRNKQKGNLGPPSNSKLNQ